MSATQQALWSGRLAEKVAACIAPDRAGQSIVCGSGISPSGPIHNGNLREVFTTRLAVETLRTRGHELVHLHSWDDYDRIQRECRLVWIHRFTDRWGCRCPISGNRGATTAPGRSATCAVPARNPSAGHRDDRGATVRALPLGPL